MKFRFKSYENGKKSTQDDAAEKKTYQQKRREQVRRAQKTHRERKESYARSLEDEVLKLRSNETKLLLQIHGLYARISKLENALTDCGIPLPGDSVALDELPNEETSPPRLGFSFHDARSANRRKQIYIQTPWAKKTQRQEIQINQSNRGPVSVSNASTTHTQRTVTHSPVAGFSQEHDLIGFADNLPVHAPNNLSPSSPSKSTLTPRSTATTLLGDLDATTLGIDFVLALENPCLAHINVEHNHDSNSPPMGHALTVSATLMYQRPVEPSHQDQHSQQAWRVPHSGIERLLELSSSIPLDGELTPVQAWDHIRRNPQYKGLDVERYRTLKEKLARLVKCYGFGAVLAQEAFEEIVFEVFAVNRAF